MPRTEASPQDRFDAHNALQRRYYEPTLSRSMQRSDSPYVRHQLERMVEFAELSPDLATLEVGSGLGKYSVPLLRAGYDLTCLDLSPVMLEDLRRAVPEIAFDTLACDAAEVAEHTGRRFERAVGFFTLHHLHDMDHVFKGLARVLAPGAIVAFCEPVATNPLYYLQIAVTPHMRWRAERGLLQMRPGKVLPAMARAGLVGLRSASFGFFPPFIANTGLGRKLEDRLEDYRFLRAFHAFRLFRGQMPK